MRSGLYRWWLSLDGDISFVLEAGRGRRLLDIGSNEGRNLALFAQSGFRAEGVEPNPVAWEASRRAGLTVHHGDLGDLAPEDSFDVVVMSNVLEHVHDPADVLAEARAPLRPGGEIWISCPNAAGWLRRCFGSSVPPGALHRARAGLVAGAPGLRGDRTHDGHACPLGCPVAHRPVVGPSGRSHLGHAPGDAPGLDAELIQVLLGSALWSAERRSRRDCRLVWAHRRAD